ncbi:hypothetical protein BUALT_Bualt15G0062500 [Buddleja alternifolia]|uniref:UBC core domain-containing protein n=1 Tax=Buddleja alternifolia TaxID=168488 RepID=A0AAV6WJN3_9LAMI|nr:hypothetical protein BUALT_Bualt15G0062500 [Buddleja alternifolia]
MRSHGMDGDGWSTRTASTQSSEDSLGSKENALTVDPFKVDEDSSMILNRVYMMRNISKTTSKTRRIIKRRMCGTNTSTNNWILDARPVNNDDFHWEARMMGPMNSPYADHFFNLIIHFGPNFPLSPPLVNFRTKVFHPNISITGGIELDILRERWNPALTIPKLMAEPNVNAPHPSSTQALQLYLDDHNSDTGKRDSRMQRYWDANEFEEDQEKNISIV